MTSKMFFFIEGVSDAEIHLLSYLLGRDRAEDNRLENDNWFRISEKKMEFDLNWSRDKQYRTLDKLHSRGIISRKQIRGKGGIKTKRFLRINKTALAKSIESGLAKANLDLPKRRGEKDDE